MPSWYTAMNPGLTSTEPVARNEMSPDVDSPATRSSATVSYTAGFICDATVRFQISS